MNKKLIIGIIAGVVALAAIVVAIVMIAGGIDFKEPAESSIVSSSQQIDSDADADDSKNDSTSDAQNSTGTSSEPIKAGGMDLGEIDGKVGEIIEVPIKLSDNPGIVAAQLQFKYDSSVLTYVDYKDGTILDDHELNVLNDEIRCVISAEDVTKDIDKDGTLITLRFKVKEGAPAGEYTIAVGDDTMIVNSNEAIVYPEITDGKITVK